MVRQSRFRPRKLDSVCDPELPKYRVPTAAARNFDGWRDPAVGTGTQDQRHDRSLNFAPDLATQHWAAYTQELHFDYGTASGPWFASAAKRGYTSTTTTAGEERT